VKQSKERAIGIVVAIDINKASRVISLRISRSTISHEWAPICAERWKNACRKHRSIQAREGVYKSKKSEGKRNCCPQAGHRHTL